MRACVVCGTEFPYGGRRTRRRFCSKLCRSRMMNAKEWNRAPHPPELLSRQCAGCGAEFRPVRITHVWCSKGCRCRTNTRRRQIRRMTGVPEWYTNTIFHRDHYICYLCNWLVDMDAVYPHPMSPIIDHIYPLSKGGAHDWRNVATAHWKCNAAKGAKIA